jgi:hypothetical protein
LARSHNPTNDSQLAVGSFRPPALDILRFSPPVALAVSRESARNRGKITALALHKFHTTPKRECILRDFNDLDYLCRKWCKLLQLIPYTHEGFLVSTLTDGVGSRNLNASSFNPLLPESLIFPPQRCSSRFALLRLDSLISCLVLLPHQVITDQRARD